MTRARCPLFARCPAATNFVGPAITTAMPWSAKSMPHLNGLNYINLPTYATTAKQDKLAMSVIAAITQLTLNTHTRRLYMILEKDTRGTTRT